MRNIKDLLLVIVCVLLLLALLEGTLQVLHVAPSGYVVPRFYTNLLGDFEPGLHIKNQMPQNHPSVFTTNSQGIRSLQEFAEEKSPGTVRVLMLGDSYTMGWGVDDQQTIPELLRKKLAARYPDKRLEVVNAGILFSNVLDHIDYFREKGRRLKADIVIEQFCYNDIDTDMRRDALMRQALRLDAGAYAKNSGSLMDFISENTALGGLAASIKAKLVGKTTDPRAMNGRSADGSRVTPDDINSLLIKPTDENFKIFNDFNVLDAEKYPAQAPFWTNYLKGVSILRKEVEDAGAQFLFYAIPTQYQVDNLRNGHSAVFYPFAFRTGMNYVDMNQVFRARTGRTSADFYLNADGHTSASGNAVVAATLADTIKIEGLKPAVVTEMMDVEYAEPKSAVLRIADAKNFTAKADPFFASVSVNNEGFVADNEGAVYVHPATENGKATLRLEFSTQQPISHIEVLAFRRAFNDKSASNGVKLDLIQGDDRISLFDFKSINSGQWDGMELAKVSEHIFGPCVDRFSLEVQAQGKAGLVFDDTFRRFQVNVYPCAVETAK